MRCCAGTTELGFTHESRNVVAAARSAADLPMDTHPPGFFAGTEMPTAGWWEALWPDPANVLASVGVAPGMDVVDLCCGDGWFTLQIAKIAAHVVAIAIDRRRPSNAPIPPPTSAPANPAHLQPAP